MLDSPSVPNYTRWFVLAQILIKRLRHRGLPKYPLQGLLTGLITMMLQLLDIKDSKEAVYGALDAWVAWEQNFPIVSIKRALLALEKEQQWHRVVQV